MNLLLLNAASGSKLEQALEKLVDFGMDAGKDILVAILIYSVGRFIIKQISVLIAKVLEKRKIETSVQTFLKSLVGLCHNQQVGSGNDQFRRTFGVSRRGCRYGTFRQSFQFCRRFDHTCFQAFQSRRLYRRTRCKRYNKGDTDLPYHTFHSWQPDDIRS